MTQLGVKKLNNQCQLSVACIGAIALMVLNLLHDESKLKSFRIPLKKNLLAFSMQKKGYANNTCIILQNLILYNHISTLRSDEIV